VSDPIEAEVDIRPISFDLAGAMAYTGLSKFRLNELAREERIVVRKDGTKNLYMRSSLDKYVQNLPVRESA
jgi:hypothetical protein